MSKDEQQQEIDKLWIQIHIKNTELALKDERIKAAERTKNILEAKCDLMEKKAALYQERFETVDLEVRELRQDNLEKCNQLIEYKGHFNALKNTHQ